MMKWFKRWIRLELVNISNIKIIFKVVKNFLNEIFDRVVTMRVLLSIYC